MVLFEHVRHAVSLLGVLDMDWFKSLFKRHRHTQVVNLVLSILLAEVFRSKMQALLVHNKDFFFVFNTHDYFAA